MFHKTSQSLKKKEEDSGQRLAWHAGINLNKELQKTGK